MQLVCYMCGMVAHTKLVQEASNVRVKVHGNPKIQVLNKCKNL